MPISTLLLCDILLLNIINKRILHEQSNGCYSVEPGSIKPSSVPAVNPEFVRIRDAQSSCFFNVLCVLLFVVLVFYMIYGKAKSFRDILIDI